MTADRPLRLLVAGGGTGGHLYPGIAVAEVVSARPGGEVLFVGTSRGLETKLIPQAGYPLELVTVSGLKRMGMAGMVRGMTRLPRAFIDSWRILRRYRPDVVLGVGGYASGPLLLVASLLGYPTAIQEQNSYPGFTNRVLGRVVRRVFLAFEEAAGHFARRRRPRRSTARSSSWAGARDRTPSTSWPPVWCGCWTRAAGCRR
jgi:UDP-N-acetylglucosamine--N-acetylmuramyl-(pentapeptide) pyrophosphoryl-undecaprenol N-acetylglucosamine transferase